MSGSPGRAVSRRTLLTGALAVTAAGCALPAAAHAPTLAGRNSRAVVSFHMDQPFLDPTGRSLPYLPASGAAVRLPDAVFLHHPYL